MSISLSGLGGSLDLSVVRDAIIADRMKPVAQLQSQSSVLASRSGALKSLNGLLATLTTAAGRLTDNTLGTAKTVTSSAIGVAGATVTSAAALGAYKINVTRTATNLTQASAGFSSRDAAILANDADTATFELRKGGATSGVTVTIDGSNNSLAGLRDAINAANAGVTASIVDVAGDGSQNQLVLVANATGASGRVELAETTSTGTLAALNLQSINPPPNGGFPDLDAQFSVNGLSVTRASNTVSDLIDGVTLNLQGAGESTINVARASDVSDRLQGFINAYNAVQDFTAAQYRKDASNRPTGVLVGDPTLRAVQQRLRDAVSQLSNNNGGSFKSLSDLGIGRDSTGKLTLDASTLNAKLKSNPGDVQALLYGANGKTGLFNDIQTACGTLSDDVSGVVHTAILGYDASVKNLTKSIADQTDRINKLRDSLTKQFAVVDAAINQLNSQGTTLSTIIDSLKPKN